MKCRLIQGGGRPDSWRHRLNLQHQIFLKTFHTFTQFLISILKMCFVHIILNQSKLCHLLAKFATNASGAIWWPNLKLMQVVPSGGQIAKCFNFKMDKL